MPTGTSKRPRPPVYAGFALHAQNFIVYAARYTPRQTGEVMRNIRAALDSGDVDFLKTFPFVGRLYKSKRPRSGVTASVRLRVFERDGGRCLYCGAQDGLEIDHVVPIVWGGDDRESNLQTLCRRCNRDKGPKPHAPRPSDLVA